MEYLRVAMVRHTLDGVPQCPLPEPYTVRWYRPGDEADWLRIHVAADAYGTFPPERFAEQFGTDAQLLARRQYYLCHPDGAAFGTTTAWFSPDYRGKPHGRIHWVAIVPEMQGRGLASPMLTLACNRLRDLGHQRAYLTSATVRVAALNLYLKFGFLPVIESDEDVRAWHLVRPHIKPDYWPEAEASLPDLA
jgi:GNAT superfamily N-acetyltransferase